MTFAPDRDSSDDEILELIFESASNGFVLVREDEEGSFRFTDVNPAAAEMLGWERDEIVGRQLTELFATAVARNLSLLYRKVIDSGEPEQLTHAHQVPGAEVVTRSRLMAIEHPDGGRGVLVISENITELDEAREDLEKDRKALRELYEVAGQADLSLDEQLDRLLEIGRERLELPFGFVTEISDGVQKIVASVGEHPDLVPGATSPLEESYCRKTLAAESDLVAFRSAEEEGITEEVAYERFGLGCYVGAQIRVREEIFGTVCFADRRARDIEFSEPDCTFVRLLAQWIGREFDRSQLMDELAERARTDALTGLANRGAIIERLREEIERADRYGLDLTFLLLDLDHFKAVNDEHGHWIGDELLRAVGGALEEAVRLPDLVGRYGGEEFAVVLPETGLEDAQRLAERLLDRVRETRVAARDEQVGVTCSIGAAEVRNADDDVETIVMRADEALYEAKDRGRDRVVTAS